ncbi:exodeoxyribonuclease V subunit alpha [Pseudonocardia oroxyli]|uniref:RecBCD enzyme subunit RecD n=1 Tax=Pseudonocardia oroxyli TaxID=366584 RepID=A0A1G7YFY1_PSEOR|nr:exodeoxyribonuclease V subunit alpha [Pseudonocardia oroxyli]SDG95451.1 DNA helicase/exodeoxyribonuclease V, alpha subunit [Pseudonocardia oroxyli]
MTSVELDRDPYDLRTARSASGLLAKFNTAGVLTAADVHVATRLGRLGGDPAGELEEVLLAVALTVRAIRNGSVCVDLAEVGHTVLGEGEESVDVAALPWPAPAAWLAAVERSPLTAVGAEAASGHPLRLVPVQDGRSLLYLDRYWAEEELVRRELRDRAAAAQPVVDLDRLRAGLARLFDPPPDTGAVPAPPPGTDLQRLAAAVAALRRVTVLAGGPGTGKTTTVARLVALLHDLHTGPTPLRVALVAPTGKAAARLGESVGHHTGRLPAEDRARVGAPTASTIHRLLGRRPGSSSRFRHDRANRLPHDVVVVDETSMVSLTLMARLLEAVRPDARIVLVGDPDQLASVEAGAVLGDLARASGTPEPALDERLRSIGALAPDDPAVVHGVVTLTHTWRFEGGIAAFADAVQRGSADEAIALLRAGHPDLLFVESDLQVREPTGLDGLRADVVEASGALLAAAREGRTADALRGLDRHRLLCAHRRGPFGVTRWSQEVERWLGQAHPGFADPAPGERAGPWWAGRPLLVTGNDYDLGLYNGDTGVVVREHGVLRAVFGRPGDPQSFAPARVGGVQTVHAMTVHRSQGSQFQHVTVVLPPPESPLLTRELLYTAVTRAERVVRLVGSEEAVRAAVGRPVSRASGLRERLG